MFVLYTGGTIGMRPGHAVSRPPQATSGLSNVGPEELLRALQQFGADEGIYWELEQLHDDQGRPVPPIDSSGVAPRHWIWMARCIERHYDEFDGFVLLHGTDTLAYTASALSFLLENLAKPVLLTGSQLPVFALRTDARQNFLNALLIAGYRASGLPLVPEVAICFGDQLLRGNRSRKASTFGWQGFVSPNYPPLGVLGESIRIRPELLRPLPSDPLRVCQELVEDVLDLTLFPGIRASQVEALLERPELRGVVLRAYGSGNAPSDRELMAVLRRAILAHKTILIVTQCHEGNVDLGRYASSHLLVESGVASGFDLTPEAALTKLMWVLATQKSTQRRIQLQLDQRGEQSLNQHEIELKRRGLQLRPARGLPAGHLERAVLRFRDVCVPGMPEGLQATLEIGLGSERLAQLPVGVHPQDLVCEVTAGLRAVRDPVFELRLPADLELELRSAKLLAVTLT